MNSFHSHRQPIPKAELDAIVVPAHPEGFKRVFLNGQCWYALKLSSEMIAKLKWIAAYQILPIQAVTHIAPIARIEPWQDSDKYQVVFAGQAKEIGPIHYGESRSGSMQRPRYTSYSRLMAATTLPDLWKR
jgi:hypothetical protein